MSEIRLESLGKRYGTSGGFALQDITLGVKGGEVYGFLGPNGAGKSTTIRLLMNFLRPTAGKASINGLDCQSDSVVLKRDVGYLSGDFAVYPKMTGQQYLDYMGALQPNTDRRYRDTLAKQFKADLRKPMGELSRGNRQKVGIIQAFMHKPSVLILDEPTSGLDPLMQEAFYTLIRDAKDRYAAIFVSSHILSEVQKVCDRIGIIRDGKLITEKNIGEMADYASQTFEITFKNKAPTAALKKIPDSKLVSSDGQQVRIHMYGSLTPLFTVLSKHEVASLDAQNLDLEEAFIELYAGHEGDTA